MSWAHFNRYPGHVLFTRELRMFPVNPTLTHTRTNTGRAVGGSMSYGSWPTSRSGALPYNKMSGKPSR